MSDKIGKILVVDDEHVVRQSCERILRPRGYEVDTVASPLTGLEKFASGGYDLIITDLKMPDMDGLEFVRRIRQQNTDINIVVITGFPSQESLKEALSLRVFDYISKPFSPDLLVDVVCRAMPVTRSDTASAPEVEEFTEEVAAKIDDIIEGFQGKRGSLIPVLQAAQELVGYLPPAVQRHVARGLNISSSEVHGVVSFYSLFTMKPKGKHEIMVCLGTACYVKRAEEIVDRLSDELNVELGGITEDKLFSFGSVNCPGTCGLAPVVMVDDEIYGGIDPVKSAEILEKYRNGGKGDA